MASKKVLSAIEICDSIADKLHKLQLSKEAIKKMLVDLWHTAQAEGYAQKSKEVKDRRERNENKRDASWKTILTEIDDKTHGGAKKSNQQA
jgi:hypothetical protein